MSMRLAVEQLSGSSVHIDVTRNMTMREVKERIKRCCIDVQRRDTTIVELIVGDQMAMNCQTVAETGVSEGSKVSAFFRQNVARCANQGALGPRLRADPLLVAEIPDSKTEVEADAFLHCKRVAEVIIPSSVTRIGDSAFFGCTALRTVSIPDSLTEIGSYSFSGCSSLLGINIPDSVTHIGLGAFMGCSSLATVRLPKSTTQIPCALFASCSSLTSLTMPDCLTHIGRAAFQGCSSLSRVTLPEQLTDIEDDAFAGCHSLAVTIPTSVCHIGPGAFSDSPLTPLDIPRPLSLLLRRIKRLAGLG